MKNFSDYLDSLHYRYGRVGATALKLSVILALSSVLGISSALFVHYNF